MAIELHRCDGLNGINDISVQQIRGEWKLCFWPRKGRDQEVPVKYCPYCGEELKDNDN